MRHSNVTPRYSRYYRRPSGWWPRRRPSRVFVSSSWCTHDSYRCRVLSVSFRCCFHAFGTHTSCYPWRRGTALQCDGYHIAAQEIIDRLWVNSGEESDDEAGDVRLAVQLLPFSGNLSFVGKMKKKKVCILSVITPQQTTGISKKLHLSTHWNAVIMISIDRKAYNAIWRFRDLRVSWFVCIMHAIFLTNFPARDRSGSNTLPVSRTHCRHVQMYSSSLQGYAKYIVNSVTY